MYWRQLSTLGMRAADLQKVSIVFSSVTVKESFPEAQNSLLEALQGCLLQQCLSLPAPRHSWLPIVSYEAEANPRFRARQMYNLSQTEPGRLTSGARNI